MSPGTERPARRSAPLPEPGEHPSPELLRTLFLFESLTDEQLGWLCDRASVEDRAAGSFVYEEGEPATCLFVLLEGTVAMSRLVRGDPVQINRTDQRGAYAGATQAYVGDGVANYPNSLRAVTDCRFAVLSSTDFAEMVRSWFPMAMHLLEGLFQGMRNSQTLIGERERLLALGQLSAGLTHELNNPAAAAVRATAALRERVSAMRHKLAGLASGKLDPDALRGLTTLQEEAVDRVAKAPRLSPVEEGDREDELADWLDDHEVRDGFTLAPVLVAAGLDPDFLEHVASSVAETAPGHAQLEGALRWITYTVETELLMNEIQDAVTRVSTLVGAAKQYSQLDRADHQDVDVHEGLRSTLVMLGDRLGGGIRLDKQWTAACQRCRRTRQSSTRSGRT